VAGLIGPGDRKSVGPMAERVAPGDYDRLHHFVSDGVWDEAPLQRELALEADKLVGGADAFPVIDDTALNSRFGSSNTRRSHAGALPAFVLYDVREYIKICGLSGIVGLSGSGSRRTPVPLTEP
jgi:hypothetical protein